MYELSYRYLEVSGPIIILQPWTEMEHNLFRKFATYATCHINRNISGAANNSIFEIANDNKSHRMNYPFSG